MTIHSEDQPSEPPNMDAEQLANYERVQIYSAVTASVRTELARRIREQEAEHARLMSHHYAGKRAVLMTLARLGGHIGGLIDAWELLTGEEWDTAGSIEGNTPGSIAE